jgi:hypothetical protein
MFLKSHLGGTFFAKKKNNLGKTGATHNMTKIISENLIIFDGKFLASGKI